MPLKKNEELSIERPSQELLKKTIETFPIIPNFGNVEFIANGIVLSSGAPGGTTGEEVYIAECNKNGVIPFSFLGFEYSESSRSFVTKATFRGGSVIPDNEKSLRSLLKGGKIYQIHADIDAHYGSRRSFDDFREKFMPLLLENGYAIRNIDLWLTYFTGSGYNEGIYRDTTLNYNGRPDKNKLFVARGHRISEENEKKVVSWFEGLKKELVPA